MCTKYQISSRAEITLFTQMWKSTFTEVKAQKWFTVVLRIFIWETVEVITSDLWLGYYARAIIAKQIKLSDKVLSGTEEWSCTACYSLNSRAINLIR